uniref:Putative ovule protein n=1 Tax=Solanum chacoense TaxID=4108 RepID=A0A0V0IUA5_SOLCH
MLLRLFKNVNGCMSDSPKIVYFWRIGHGCGIESEESVPLRFTYLTRPQKMPHQDMQRENNTCHGCRHWLQCCHNRSPSQDTCQIFSKLVSR